MAKNIMSVFTTANSKSSAGSMSAEFENGRVASMDSTPETAPRSVMTLGKTLFFKGELEADEDVLLLGRVEGKIFHTESLTVGAGGVVIGDIRARTIHIKGTVEGDLCATESIVISPTAVVTGDVVAARVCLLDGSKFNGTITMTNTQGSKKESSRPDQDDEELSAHGMDRMLSRR